MTVKDGATDVSDQKLISSDKDCYIYIVALYLCLKRVLFHNHSYLSGKGFEFAGQ